MQHRTAACEIRFDTGYFPGFQHRRAKSSGVIPDFVLAEGITSHNFEGFDRERGSITVYFTIITPARRLYNLPKVTICNP